MKVLVPVADGSEDIETVTIIDTLRRAHLEVTVASIGPQATVTASRGTRIVADCLFADAAPETFDLIALPGGTQGAEALGRHAPLIEKLRAQKSSGRWLAAICAAPALALAANGLLDDRRATCYPSFRDRLPKFSDEKVTVDGNLVTSQGPATALAFALKLIELLCGKDKAREIGKAMLATA